MSWIANEGYGLYPALKKFDCDVNRVLLHAHGGGTVIFSMHLDRKAVGHIANAAGARALVLDYRRSPEHRFPAQIEDMEKARRTSDARNACPLSLFSFS